MRVRSKKGGARGRRRLRLPAVLLGALAVVALACVALFAAPPTITRGVLHPVSHVESILDSAERHDVDPLLVCAVISCESGWDASAVSRAGAVGLMQVMPATAESLVALGEVDGASWPPADVADPAVNIEYGCAYLGYLERHLTTVEEVIAAYNAGIGSVQQWVSEGGTIPEDIRYAETRAYLDRVLEAYAGYRASYPSGLM